MTPRQPGTSLRVQHLWRASGISRIRGPVIGSANCSTSSPRFVARANSQSYAVANAAKSTRCGVYITRSNASVSIGAGVARVSKMVPPPSLPTITSTRGRGSASPSNSDPASCRSARSPSTTLVTAPLATAIPSPVDTGESSVGVGGNPAPRHHTISLANKPGRAPHQPIVRPGCRPHGGHEHPSIKRFAKRVKLRTHIRALCREVSHMPGLITPATKPGADGILEVNNRTTGCEPPSQPVPLGIIERMSLRGHRSLKPYNPASRVVPLNPVLGDHNALHTGSLDELWNLTGQRGVTEHHDSLHARDQGIIRQHLSISGHEVRAESGTAGDLGNERPAARSSELLGGGTGTGTGNDNGSRCSRNRCGFLCCSRVRG